MSNVETNQVIKAGDLVKYHSQNDELDSYGIKLGQFFEVTAENGTLWVRVLKNNRGSVDVPLVKDGVLTEFSDCFALHRCPVVLPRGKAV